MCPFSIGSSVRSVKHNNSDAFQSKYMLQITHIQQVSELWKISYKLTKSFFGQQELMGPFRVATSLKAKVEKFKIRLPIITALCTAGMKDRHWDMMSKKVIKSTLILYCF